MTKKVKGAIVSIEVTDDGSLKELGLNADKTSKKLDKTGKSTRDVNRNMQAMSGRVESGTKGFARMQQGTGGLVQSYAILASTLFAVGAAFRAFQNAANIENQIKGFRMLGSITGQSMMGVTASIRQATGGLLNFQDAAQQGAIGLAAGFNQEQLTGLAEGAKLASVTLGRDLTDSFNRLVRGVTKAEPELLDELGIILRLDIATRKFANANGLIAEKLTIAQRRAAVFEEVQRQLVANFGAMGSEADELLNPFDRLSTKISDFFIAIQGPFVGVFGEIADFISNNFGALITAVTMFALSIIKQIVPSFQAMGAAAVNAGDKAKGRIKDLEKAVKKEKSAIKQVEKEFSAGEVRKNKIFTRELKRRGISVKQFTNMTLKEQKKLVAQMMQDEKKGLTHTKKMNKQRLASYTTVFKRIQKESKKTQLTLTAHAKVGGAKLRLLLAKPAFHVQKAITGIGAAAARLAPIFSLLGTIVNMAFGVIMAFFTAKFFVDMLPSVKRINESFEAMNEKTKVSEETLKDMAFTVGSSLDDKKIIDIKEAFGSLEGTARAANFEMERANEILQRGISGKALIEDMEKDLIENFSEGQALSSFGQLIQNAVFGVFGVQAVTMHNLFGGLIEAGTTQKLIEQGFSSTAMDTAAQTVANNFLTNYLKVFETGTQQDKDKMLAMLFPPGMGAELQAELEKALSGDEAGRSARVMKVIDRFSNRLVQMTDFQPFDVLTDGSILLTEAMIDNVNAGDDIIANLLEITEVTGNVKDAGKEAREVLQNMIPKPSQAEAFMTSLGNITSNFANFDDDGNFTGFKQFLVDQEELDEKGQQRLSGVIQAARESLGITLEQLGLEEDKLPTYDEQNAKLKELLDKEVERLNFADLLLDTTKAFTAALGTQVDNLKFINTRTSKRMQQEMKILTLREKQVQNLAKIGIKTTDIMVLSGKVAENRDREAINVAAANRQLENQIELLEASLDRVEMLGKAVLETFDKSAASNLATLIETANLGEFGGKELGLGLAKELRKTSAKALAETFVDPVTEALTPKRFKLNRKLDPAQQILAAHKQHIDGLGAILQAHVKAMQPLGAGSMSVSEFKPVDPAEMKYGDLFPSALDGNALEGGFRETLGNFFTGLPGNLRNFIFGKKGEVLKGFDHTAIGSPDGFRASLPEGLTDEQTTALVAGEDVDTSLPNIFQRVFGEDGMFAKVGKGIFGKEGLFAKIGKSLFGEDGLLSGMFKGIFGGGEGGGGFFKFLAGLFGGGAGAGGGAVGMAKGGIMGYSTGGIARQPTYLVGEGKRHEAVVPLPDNRSIPVNLQGAMGNQNNTNITVNIDGTGAQSSVDSQGSKEFADAINGVVQAEIERQMRPGGILAGG